MVVMEALSAGAHVLVPNQGALPGIVGNFGTTFDFDESSTKSIQHALTKAIDSYWEPESILSRRSQQVYAAERFGWGSAGISGQSERWIRLLGVMHDLFNERREMQRSDFQSAQEFSEALSIAGKVRQVRSQTGEAVILYNQALQVEPYNSIATLSLGDIELRSNDLATVSRAMSRFEFLLKRPDSMIPPVSIHSLGYFYAGTQFGTYLSKKRQLQEAKHNFDLVLNTSWYADDCSMIYRAGLLPADPRTLEEEISNFEDYHSLVDQILARDDIFCRSSTAQADAFAFAYLYDGTNYRDEISKWVQLRRKVYPELFYNSPTLTYEDPEYLLTKESIAHRKELKNRKIKLGVVSSYFVPSSSIWGNFGGVVQGMQQDDRFDVSLIFYPQSSTASFDESSVLLSLNPETNVYLRHMDDEASTSVNQGMLESKNYDALLYLDLFMAPELHNLAGSKLAPVQFATHGHPITSGISQEIMDYFISWDLAELPDLEAAKEFYTEELLIIKSSGRAWQTLTPRTKDGISVFGGQSFLDFTRNNLTFVPTAEYEKLKSRPHATWYFCPQAQFKYHHTFHKILAKIQSADPNAFIIIVKAYRDDSFRTTRTANIEERMQTAGVDLARVVFIPRMQHAHLMAMYKLADVVLDSVYFGGDTTTREAFEVGAPIITLPGKILGQRWTQAYYKVLGITDFIATSVDDYVQKAVTHANSSGSKKASTRARIVKAAQKKLFGDTKAPKLWADAIFEAMMRPTRWHYGANKDTMHGEL
jgi:predicted O-linked N-acetylglucosamine transferase (SPINDLY family)